MAELSQQDAQQGPELPGFRGAEAEAHALPGAGVLVDLGRIGNVACKRMCLRVNPAFQAVWCVHRSYPVLYSAVDNYTLSVAEVQSWKMSLAILTDCGQDAWCIEAPRASGRWQQRWRWENGCSLGSSVEGISA